MGEILTGKQLPCANSPSSRTISIVDPVRIIYSRLDKLFDAVTRLNRDLPSIFLVPPNLLANIRSVQVHSQLVNVCGRYFRGGPGATHTWAYDFIAYFLLHCPMLDDMEVEIDCAWYQFKEFKRYTGIFPFHRSLLMPLEHGVSPIYLRNTGVISAAGARWASTQDWSEFFRSMHAGESTQRQSGKGLSRFSIALTGKSFYRAVFALKNVWYILQMLGTLDTIKDFEVRNSNTVAAYTPNCGWFTMATPQFSLQEPRLEFRARNVKSLGLEFGEYQTYGSEMTISQLKASFPSLEAFSITKVGLFIREPTSLP
ncbi:hypothetical protein TWF718_000114 [Orbilia javanica]|uniref:Uncharacterized protein n=1 Tax=Orbilia javanica TaxID=47235 RepID=A0AAN8RLR5_9PEZI